LRQPGSSGRRKSKKHKTGEGKRSLKFNRGLEVGSKNINDQTDKKNKKTWRRRGDNTRRVKSKKQKTRRPRTGGAKATTKKKTAISNERKACHREE